MTSQSFEFDPTRALPAISYRDPAWLSIEMDRIWHGDWVFVSTEDAISNPGDQLPVVIGNQPVLLLRNQSGDLTALSNLCAHRGTLLVEEPTNGKRIQCPYHAWTYDDAGKLIACPFETPGSIDRDSHCLPVYRVESWHGLVFVSLNPDVESLKQRFSAVKPFVEEQGLGVLHQGSAQEVNEDWECNWKIAITNAMESYHLFKVHPTTLEPITPSRSAYYIAGSARATATGGTVKGGSNYLLISLPPTFVGVFTDESFFWVAVHPIDPHRCTLRAGGTYGSDQNAGAFRQLTTYFTDTIGSSALTAVLSEDKAICERIQRGIGGDFRPGQLLPIERVVMDFGHYLNWRINDVEPPSVHAEQRS